MNSWKRFNRIVAVSLMVLLALGVTPMFTVQAQQSRVQTQTASPSETSKARTSPAKGQSKKLAKGELARLSEAEMEGVEGEWVQTLVGIGVGVALWTASTWQANHNAHGHRSEIHLHWKVGGFPPRIMPVVHFHHYN